MWLIAEEKVLGGFKTFELSLFVWLRLWFSLKSMTELLAHAELQEDFPCFPQDGWGREGAAQIFSKPPSPLYTPR